MHLRPIKVGTLNFHQKPSLYGLLSVKCRGVGAFHPSLSFMSTAKDQIVLVDARADLSLR